MFDKILSGNKNISCATCHHPFAATSDGLSLPVGEGGRGLSTARDLGVFSTPAFERVPRNSPALFNLGAHEFSIMFHDGRVEVDPNQPSGFISPAAGPRQRAGGAGDVSGDLGDGDGGAGG
jgi:cytochrome c peroxidase